MTRSKIELNRLQLNGMAYVHRWPNRAMRMNTQIYLEMTRDCALEAKCLNLGIQTYHNRSQSHAGPLNYFPFVITGK